MSGHENRGEIAAVEDDATRHGGGANVDQHVVDVAEAENMNPPLDHRAAEQENEALPEPEHEPQLGDGQQAPPQGPHPPPGDLRGWLVTVAALFVTLSFEAVLHPPHWLKPEWYTAKAFVKKSFGPETAEVTRAFFYLSTNIFTFGTALTAVLFLLSGNWTLPAVTKLMWFLSLFLACAFATCTSADWGMSAIVLLGTGAYAALAANFILGVPIIRILMTRLRYQCLRQDK